MLTLDLPRTLWQCPIRSILLPARALSGPPDLAVRSRGRSGQHEWQQDWLLLSALTQNASVL